MVITYISHEKIFFSLKVNSALKPNERNDVVVNDIIQRYDISNNKSVVEKLKFKLSNTFFTTYGKYLKKLPRNKRNFDEFEKKYNKWLNNERVFHYDDNCKPPTAYDGGKFSAIF